LLAAFAAIRHFHHFCEGQSFQLWTDHKPLVTALYLPGVKNVAANFLSPFPTALEFTETVATSAAADPVDFEAMAAEQDRCAETQRLPGSSSLHLAFRQAGTQRLAGNVSTGFFCPIVPQKFRKYIFFHFHNISHPGRLASRRMVSSRFVWRGLATDITAWSRACLHCQQAKIHPSLPQPVPIPQRHFSHLHIYLVGPLQYSSGCNFIFTVTDRTSKWMEAIPVSDTSAAACAKALLDFLDLECLK
jgi:hypothetical protein